MPLADDIAAWIRTIVTEAGAQGVVIGLSGGLDSSVVAALAARALPGKVLGAILPCESAPRDSELARLVAEQFQAEAIELDLTAAHRVLAATLPEASTLVRANVKPRLRMLTLYYLAASRGCLVCGASNRSELAIGYFTKFGDGGVDLMPIGGLLKRQVRELARDLGVPQPIIDRPPTAGLWPGQTDEGEMGLLYAQLDAAIEAMDRHDTRTVPPHVLSRVRQMMAASAHKRALPPIYVPPMA
ncbi:MAG TPA: NAD(+) synthase [Planctomycetota bacterium]|nr:NAD(+) synthase [Planctomycetota bacterium]